MLVTFIRHAESNFNRYHDMSKDVDLSKEGTDQARQQLKDQLRDDPVFRDHPVELVLCSPLRRTKRTLQLSGLLEGIHAPPPAVEITELCREVVDGNPINECATEPTLAPESEKQITARLARFRTLLKKKQDGGLKHVAVFSHGMFLLYLLRNVHPQLFWNCEAVTLPLSKV